MLTLSLHETITDMAETRAFLYYHSPYDLQHVRSKLIRLFHAATLHMRTSPRRVPLVENEVTGNMHAQLCELHWLKTKSLASNVHAWFMLATGASNRWQRLSSTPLPLRRSKWHLMEQDRACFTHMHLFSTNFLGSRRIFAHSQGHRILRKR